MLFWEHYLVYAGFTFASKFLNNRDIKTAIEFVPIKKLEKNSQWNNNVYLQKIFLTILLFRNTFIIKQIQYYV